MAELYRSDIVDVDIGKSLLRTYAGKVLATGDRKANRFGANINRAGEPIDLTGCSVTGYFIRPNMQTVVVTGEAEGSTAYVDLPQACYTNEGAFSLALKVSETDNDITQTVRVIDGCIRLTQTGELVDPGEVIPSLDEIFAQIAAVEAATQGARQATKAANTLVDEYNVTVKAQNEAIDDLSNRTGNMEAAIGISVTPSKNLLDPADLVVGQWSTGGTTLTPDEAYRSYQKRIPVEGNTTYTISSNGVSTGLKVATLVEFDANGERPGIKQYWADTTFTTAETTTELLISIQSTWDRPQLEKGDAATAYEPYGDMVSSELKDEVNDLQVEVARKKDDPLYGKSICAFGDSIAASDDGDRNVKTWIDFVAEYFGCANAYNRGVGGTSVTATTKDGTARVGYVYVDAAGDAGEVRGMYSTARTFEGYPNLITPWMCTEQRIKTIPEDTAAVVIIAGTNDVGTTTVEGFAEAYGQMLDLMAALRPNMQIYTCTMPFQQTYDLGTAADVAAYNAYRDAIKRVSMHHGVSCIDLRQTMGVNVDNYTEFMTDATHYNSNAGRRLIAESVCDAILSGCGYAGAAGLAVHAQEADHANDADTVKGVDVVSTIAQLAPGINCEASGDLVSVSDATDAPAVKIISRIEAAQAGTGDPSPENVRAITGWDSVMLTRAGENLLDWSHYKGFTRGGVTYTRQNDGGIRITGTAENGSDSSGITWKGAALPPGTYCTALFGKSDGVSLQTVVKLKRTGANQWYTTGKFTIQPGDEIQYTYINVTAGTVVDATVYPMMVSGDVDPAIYQPCDNASLTMTLPETIYGGMLDWTTGVLTSDFVFRSFDGSEDWRSINPGDVHDFYRVKIEDLNTAVAVEYNKCSHMGLADIRFSTTNIGFNVVNSPSYAMDMLVARPDLEVFPDVATWKAYLSAQFAAGTPVQVIYKLANPIKSIQLTPQQLDLLKGSNHLWSDCGGTDVTYIADTKTYIDNKFAALAAQLIDA